MHQGGHMEPEMEAARATAVKAEEEEATMAASPSSSSSSSSSSNIPVPPPTPFLRKTYEMVEDAGTDSMVSWSQGRNSFVVWDAHAFSAELLPKYFKHSNFSSFIRQLNTYGFRKVDPDRWEFASEGFLAGQKHLLATIKRRRRHVSQDTLQGGRTGVESGQSGREGELERLRRDRGTLMAEIERLKQQHHHSRDLISSMSARLQTTERRQQQMVAFLAKALNSPCFVQQLVRQDPLRREPKRVQFGCKRRLTASPNLENSQGDVVAVTDLLNQNQEESVTLESEMPTIFQMAGDDELSNHVKEAGTGTTSDTDQCGGNGDAANDLILEQFLSEDLMTGNPEEEILVGDQPQIDVEVEDLCPSP